MDRLKLMQTYAAVVQFGNYTRAAKELGVTRAMVSKRILDLEDMLGVKLLNRNTHTLSVTATGADYYESCNALLADLSALEDRMQARRADPRGLLKILTSKTFGETILAPVVAEFCKLYPNISIQMALGDWDMGAQGADLMSAGYDIAIRTLPVRDSSLVARSIITLPRVLVAAPDYLERHGTPRAPQDLTDHNCLDSRSAPHHTWDFEGPGRRSSIRVTGSPRANSSIAILHAARTGLGIAMLIEYLVRDDLETGRLVPVLETWRTDPRKLYVIYQKDNYQPLRTRVFIDYLARRMKEFSNDESAFSPGDSAGKKPRRPRRPAARTRHAAHGQP